MVRVLVLSYFVLSSINANAVCPTGLDSFKKNLYPLLQSRCTLCHGDDGFAAPHSVSDPEKAYSVARKFVNGTDLPHSKIIEKVKEKHWLDYEPNEVGATDQEMLSAITNFWNEGELSCEDHYDLKSNALIIPSNIPSRASGQFLLMQWNLELVDSRLKDVLFEVEIQKFTEEGMDTPGSYRLRAPRLVLKSKIIQLKGIRFAINNQIRALENTYEEVDRTLLGVDMTNGETFNSDRRSLSVEHLILLQSQTQDTLAVYFKKFQLLNSIPICKAQDVFNQKVSVLFTNKCTQCHFTSSITPTQMCPVSKQYVDLLYPSISPLISFSHKGFNGHDAVLTFDESKSLMNWINAER